MSVPVRLFVPGALAAAAVVSFGVPAQAAGPEASTASAAPGAAARACGQPAVPATYQTVSHPAVYETVPAVTHLEWLWTRTIQHAEAEHSRVVTPAYDVYAWQRVIETIEREYVWTVVDQPFVPAVPGTPEIGHFDTVVIMPAITITEHEYRHRHNGSTRWEIAGWNAGPGGLGWVPTGASRVVELVPAVTQQVWVVDQPAVPGTPEIPEVSHQEFAWVLDGDTPPVGSSATGASRVASSITEDEELPEGQSPEGAGWVRGAVVETVAAVLDHLWLPLGEPSPAGYTPTGATRPAGSTVETTADRSATAPAGDGWSQVADSAETVVDVPESTVLVEEAWTEEVVVVPAVPATAPCDTDDEDDDGGATGPGDDDGSDGVAGGVAGDDDDAVLPATGATAPWWLAALGLGGVVGGTALTRRGRRRTAS